MLARSVIAAAIAEAEPFDMPPEITRRRAAELVLLLERPSLRSALQVLARDED